MSHINKLVILGSFWLSDQTWKLLSLVNICLITNNSTMCPCMFLSLFCWTTKRGEVLERFMGKKNRQSSFGTHPTSRMPAAINKLVVFLDYWNKILGNQFNCKHHNGPETRRPETLTAYHVLPKKWSLFLSLFL